MISYETIYFLFIEKISKGWKLEGRQEWVSELNLQQRHEARQSQDELKLLNEDDGRLGRLDNG